MKRYIQHPQTGKLIPRDEYQLESRKTSWQVLPDIQPYISQIDGHIVPSRNAHRAHLLRLFAGAMLIAGGFSFLPGRTMALWAFG